jgi:UDP-glucose 4-epimerase
MIAITGGCGFIGSRLALALRQAGVDVTVLDIAPTPLAGCAVRPVDIRDPGALRGAFDGAEAVVHCAALLGRSCERDPNNAWETNIAGTALVLEEAARARVPRIVFASTGGVYVGGPYPVTERASVAPRTLYVATKLTGEAMFAAAAMQTGAAAVALRLFTVFGPGGSGARGHFIAGWIERMLRREPLEVHGDGSQTVDATHVGDVVRAFRLAIRAPMRPGENRVFNIGSDRETTVLEIARALRSVDPRIAIRRVAALPNTPRRQLADIRHAREQLGYAPTIEPLPAIAALAHDALVDAVRAAVGE